MTAPDGPSTGPLTGIQVIDLTQAAAGPFCTQHLGDLGADVIKVEPPQGDMIRGWDDADWKGLGTYFLGLNRNKRSVKLDLKKPAAAQAVRQLCAEADVVVQNSRPGAMQRLGLGYETLSQDHPELVYVSISAFGEDGPLRDAPGMDIVLQAFGGIMGITGVEGGEPVKVGAPIADLATGYAAAMATVTALFERERSGAGQQVSISMLNVVVSLMSNHTTGHLLRGNQIYPNGSAHPQLVPYQAFPTRDGSYVIVGILNEGFWSKFCAAIDREDLRDHPHFATNRDRLVHRFELLEIITPLMKDRPVEDWERTFTAADVPHTRVNSFADLFTHPQAAANDLVVSVEHPVVGKIPVIAQPARFSRTPGSYRLAPGFLGEHTEEVLRETGLDGAELAALGMSGDG